MMIRIALAACIAAMSADGTKAPEVGTTTRVVESDMSKPASPEERTEYSFLHMTDLHVSMNRPYSLETLRNFCDTTFPALTARGNILFLALTGDLTDGMGRVFSLEQFGQLEADWTALRKALDGCIKQGVPMFNIRGNHDAFGVHSFNHPSNDLFTSLQSETHGLLVNSSLQVVAFHEESGSMALFHPESNSRFVFLDAGRTVPSPHQYHGEFSESQARWLEEFIGGKTNTKTQTTYVFIHFPLGCLTPESRQRLLRAVAPSSSRVTFLSGHIHSLIGKRGVQAIRSHDDIDELQLSDFKWSGAVRRVDINTGLFVDVPADGTVSVTIQLDPDVRTSDETGRTLLGIHANANQVIDTVTRCSGSSESSALRPGPSMSFFFSPSPAQLHCVEVSVIDSQTGKRSMQRVTAVDTRLGNRSFARLAFSYFFETLQIVLLFEYVVLVVVARFLFIKLRNVPLTLYLVLSPVIPSTVSDNFFDRPWVLSNGVAGIDLETSEVFIDYETVRLGIMMLLYLLFAIAVLWTKPQRSFVGKLGWVLFLLPLTMVDMRMTVSRGGLKTLTLSPHIWIIVYLWYLLITQGRRALSSKKAKTD